MLTNDEATELAREVLGFRSRSYVSAALDLAAFVLAREESRPSERVCENGHETIKTTCPMCAAGVLPDFERLKRRDQDQDRATSLSSISEASAARIRERAMLDPEVTNCRHSPPCTDPDAHEVIVSEESAEKVSAAVWAWTGMGCDVCGFGSVENLDEFDPTKPCPECGTVATPVGTRVERKDRRDRDGLDPGIRRLVDYLNAHGFETCDSGDGVSKPAAGNDECETEPHVYMIVTPPTMVAEAHRLEALLATDGIDAPELRIECSYSPCDMTAILSLHGVSDKDLLRGTKRAP